MIRNILTPLKDTETGDVVFLSTAEVAKLIRTPVSTLRYWRHVGIGPRSFIVGRRVVYLPEDVQAFIDAAVARTSRGGVNPETA